MLRLKDEKNLFVYIEPLIIAVFWMVLFMSPIFLSNSDYGLDWNYVFRIWISYTPYLLLFLINRFVLLPYLFFKNRRLLFLGSVLVLIIGMSIGVFYFRRFIFQRPDQMERFERFHTQKQQIDRVPPGSERLELPKPPPRELPPFIGFIVISILIVGFDTGLRVSVKFVRSEQVQSFIEKENMQMQLAYLRNQVSPHFFMNTLNNIHALIDIDTEEAKESIIRLSKLMRHLLYECDAELIPVMKEVEFIRNYVELMRLRYSDKIQIELLVPAQLPDKQIPPLLFTSFVENAFKHGVSYQKSIYIKITFLYADDNLHFQIRNNHAGVKSENDYSGIGIANSKKRLDLIYGDQYTLEIEDKNEEFIVTLNIPV